MDPVANMLAKAAQFNEEIKKLSPPAMPTPLKKEWRAWAVSALIEEAEELKLSETVEDQVDALLDSIYFALGELHKIGVGSRIIEAFDTVHAANMQKIAGNVSKRPGPPNCDAVKPKGWKPPDLSFLTYTEKSGSGPPQKFKIGDKVTCRIRPENTGVVIETGTYRIRTGDGHWIKFRKNDGTEFSAMECDLQPPNLADPSKGTKYSQGKVPYQLISPTALELLGKVLDFGARKYAPNNWRKGLNWTEVLRACLSHTLAILRGEDYDICEKHNGVRPDDCQMCSGLLHSGHLFCEGMFLVDHQLLKLGTDDRWVKP